MAYLWNPTEPSSKPKKMNGKKPLKKGGKKKVKKLMSVDGPSSQRRTKGY